MGLPISQIAQHLRTEATAGIPEEHQRWTAPEVCQVNGPSAEIRQSEGRSVRADSGGWRSAYTVSAMAVAVAITVSWPLPLPQLHLAVAAGSPTASANRFPIASGPSANGLPRVPSARTSTAVGVPVTWYAWATS